MICENAHFTHTRNFSSFRSCEWGAAFCVLSLPLLSSVESLSLFEFSWRGNWIKWFLCLSFIFLHIKHSYNEGIKLHIATERHKIWFNVSISTHTHTRKFRGYFCFMGTSINSHFHTLFNNDFVSCGGFTMSRSFWIKIKIANLFLDFLFAQ
jgi:hypothetical protein